MLKMSTRSTYAIRALTDLGSRAENGPVRLGEIAERQRIPLPYLEQIFYKLKGAGLVRAMRGPQGGYRLAKDPHDISLAEIITVLEGPLGPLLCSMPENFSPRCHEDEGCASRFLCSELDGHLHAVLAKNTLGMLCAESKKLLKNKKVRPGEQGVFNNERRRVA